MKTGFQRLVIVLLVLNLIAVSAFWFLHGGNKNGGREDRSGQGQGAGPRNEIIDRLHFDKGQVAQYDSLIVKHRKLVGQKEKEIQGLRTSLFMGVSDGIDSKLKDSWVRQIGVLHADIQQIHFAHFLDIQKICKPEQRADFECLTKDLSTMFRGRGPKGNADDGPKGNADGGQKSNSSIAPKSEAP
jgi:protein CpxP